MKYYILAVSLGVNGATPISQVAGAYIFIRREYASRIKVREANEATWNVVVPKEKRLLEKDETVDCLRWSVPLFCMAILLKYPPWN